MGSHGAGRHVNYRGRQFTGNLEHIGQHQQQALGGREGGGQAAGLQGTVDGASGPRLLRLAGKVADGAIILVGTAPEFLQGALACIAEGAKDAGRDLHADGFRTICWTPCAIDADGDAARHHVKSHVARVLKRPLPFTLPPEDQAVVTNIYEHYEYYQHMVVGTPHSDLVPDRLVPKFAIAGTVAECREQVQALIGTGVQQVAIIPHTPHPADRLALVRTFAEEVMAQV